MAAPKNWTEFFELVWNDGNGMPVEATIDPTGLATSAKQDTQITAEQAILAKIIAAPATEAKQDTLIAKDFATQTTLAAVLAKIIAAPATEAKQDAILDALDLIAPGSHVAAITPDNDNDLDDATRAIIVGVAGNVKIDSVGGENGVTIPLQAGQWDIRATRVYATGTTATGLVALW